MPSKKFVGWVIWGAVTAVIIWRQVFVIPAREAAWEQEREAFRTSSEQVLEDKDKDAARLLREMDKDAARRLRDKDKEIEKLRQEIDKLKK